MTIKNMDPNLPKNVSGIKLPFPSASLGQKIIMFGLPTCEHCARVKQFFADHNVEYEYHDVSTDTKARDWLVTIVDFVPVLVFKDGSFLFGPDDSQIAPKLGIN